MTTPTPPDGSIPLKDWIAAAPIGKTAAYALRDALGMTLESARFGSYPRPVPFLNPEQRATLERAAAAIANGTETVASIAAKTAGASGEITPAAHARAAALAAPEPAAAALAQPETIAALVAAIAQAMPQQQAPEPDPLRVAERLAAAATAGHWLTTAELAALLGVHRTAPDPVRWVERFPRPGYRVETVKHGGHARFWRLSFDGPAPVPGRTLAAADRPAVGFGAVLEASAVTLERRASMIGGPQLPSLPRAWS
jgi:hypothetical protein